MRIYNDIDDLSEFKPWGPAVQTYDKICDDGLGEMFIRTLEDVYPEGIREVDLNDILAYEPEYALELAGIEEEPDEDEEDY